MKEKMYDWMWWFLWSDVIVAKTNLMTSAFIKPWDNKECEANGCEANEFEANEEIRVFRERNDYFVINLLV